MIWSATDALLVSSVLGLQAEVDFQLSTKSTTPPSKHQPKHKYTHMLRAPGHVSLQNISNIFKGNEIILPYIPSNHLFLATSPELNHLKNYDCSSAFIDVHGLLLVMTFHIRRNQIQPPYPHPTKISIFYYYLIINMYIHVF